MQKNKNNFISKNLIFLIIIISFVSIGLAFYYTRAAFVEPTSAPSASDQDFFENILGANNADNDFNSGMVIADNNGSIIERIKYFEDYIENANDDIETYGRGWVASSSGDASTALTYEACEDASGWYWFEDANGDGDYIDIEDGVCILETAVSTGILSWNGYDYTSNPDNTYIADYECEGSFPSGTITTGTYNGLDSGGSADTTWNDGDCALCQTDCYDGRKDLPDQGSYTSNSGGTGGYEGPITNEILKNWKGTRLPNSLDFFGYCGYKDGGSDYETACSSDITTGDYGSIVGRVDECLDLSSAATREWTSERHLYDTIKSPGYYSCSYMDGSTVDASNRFRALFRP